MMIKKAQLLLHIIINYYYYYLPHPPADVTKMSASIGC